MRRYSTLNNSLLRKWDEIVRSYGISEKVLNPSVRVIKDPSDKSNYSFGMIYNPHRFQRLSSGQTDTCRLCAEVKLAESGQKERVLYSFPGFIVVPNKFPILRGASLAISTGTEQMERPMYTTKNLDHLAAELRTVFAYANSTGFSVYHNNDGFGATISKHEHWQFVDFGVAYDLAGEKYGFEGAEYQKLKNHPKIKIMPKFKFAHLIFKNDDPERIAFFLRKLGKNLGSRFERGFIPHSISHGGSNILVVPSRIYKEKSIASGEVAGHFVSKTEEEFSKADYCFCIKKLSEVLFKDSELNLESFL